MIVGMLESKALRLRHPRQVGIGIPLEFHQVSIDCVLVGLECSIQIWVETDMSHPHGAKVKLIHCNLESLAQPDSMERMAY